MNKYLILSLYILLFTFSFQYFFANKTGEIQNQNGVLLSIQKDSIVIPNAPHIEVQNHSGSGFTVNPCTDMSISIDSRPLTDIEKSAPVFCQDIRVGAKEKKILPMSELSTIMSNFPGKYLITVKTPEGDRTTSFTLSRPGTFRSALTTLVYNPIYNLFVALLTWLPGHSLGWAIIIITVIIRLILLVPQQHMMESQKKLQVIQPKIKELQKKYKDDQAKLGMEMLDLYKKENVSPMGSCLPLLIQMPILIGLYWVISSINDPSNFYHLYSFFREFRPSAIDTHFFGMDLKSIGGKIGIAFALILAVFQYIQARLSFSYNPPAKPEEKKVTKEGEMPEFALDPAMMQKSMLYVLPVMI
jgi:YidC/Oxa1 family membrane protein insertase